MSSASTHSERIVIVGGGFAGLSAAVLLSQAGLPVTVLEASTLGYAASTHNQGWLHSGAWFARTHPELARQCYESMRQTIKYCPDCLEPGLEAMTYLSLSNRSDASEWTTAWEKAGIPYQRLLTGEIHWQLPKFDRDRIKWAFRLPDRSFRPDVLLSQLAATARNAGAEVRAGSFVSGLLIKDRSVYGVGIGSNEEMHARLVILATGAYSKKAFSYLYDATVGKQWDVKLVNLKTHLRAIRPGLTADPFCIVDGIGLNHLPHHTASVFGTGRWEVVHGSADNEVESHEVELIEEELKTIFPDGFSGETQVQDWAGTTVQAMHVEQIEPGVAPLPTIVDHAREPGGIENLLSIFPGRATLWPHLAEQVRLKVFEQVEQSSTSVATPPWG